MWSACNSPDTNDVRSRAVHEARLAPGPLREDAEERARNDTTRGAVWSQLILHSGAAVLCFQLTDALRYAAEESCAQLLQRDDVEEEERGVLAAR